MSPKLSKLVTILYCLGGPLTFAWVLYQDIGSVHGWKWLIAIPLDLFIAAIWPGYWLAVLVRALF